MGYRIHLGIVKIKDLKDQLHKDFSNIECEVERYEAEQEFFYNTWDVELQDNLDLNQFRPIKKYKDDEYPPYRLNKKDFQKILDYYKKMICEDSKEKERISNNKELFEKDRRHLISVSTHYMYIHSYFERLIKSNKNICSSGLFLLDYFYLVRVFESMKTNECVIITHG